MVVFSSAPRLSGHGIRRSSSKPASKANVLGDGTLGSALIGKNIPRGFSSYALANMSMFRVNMYASAWICTKTTDVVTSPVLSLKKVGTSGSLEASELRI